MEMDRTLQLTEQLPAPGGLQQPQIGPQPPLTPEQEVQLRAAQEKVVLLQQQVQSLEAHCLQLQARIRPASAPPVLEGSEYDCKNLDTWFQRVMIYLQASGIRDVKLAILHTVALFGTVPMRWWQTIAPNPGDVPFSSYEEFRLAVRLAFPAVLTDADARQHLYTMTQRHNQNLMSFLAAFQAVASRISDLGAPEKMFHFLRAVQPPIRAELLRVNPPDFQSMVAVASHAAAIVGMSKSLGSQYWKPRQEAAQPMELGQLTSKRPGQRSGRPRRKQRQQAVGPPTWGLTAAELVKHKAEGRCYRCHEEGHMWRQCTKGRRPNGK